jgi:hypothetical protein
MEVNMEDERSVRLHAGCAILFIVDSIALCVLIYLALGAGLLLPMDCTTEHERACEAARSSHYQRIAFVFWVTIAVNVAFVVWSLRGRNRQP